MVRVRNWCSWSRGKRLSFIWFTSAILFYLGFRMAIQNSTAPPTDKNGSNISNSVWRSRLYDKMARDLDEKGAGFLRGGQTSQSLSLSDIFTLKDGSVTPVLKVYWLRILQFVLLFCTSVQNSRHLFLGRMGHTCTLFMACCRQAVRSTFLPYFDKAIWFQNTSLYHFSMFHASHHLEPVIAAENEIEIEANAVKAVAEALCPLKIVLDRVVLTSTGVLLGCWQVISGSDPVTIRAKLRNALPRAPEKQLYDPVLLHTSFARILGQPKISPEEMQKPFDQLQFFHELVERVNNQIRGFEAAVSELWFVEELDVLALALNGRMKERKFHLGCSGD
ncbi:uncharacterized protein LOC143861429 isoform X1 [Tasmannia lanceolata]|uniref:uncharacterized protein LOC143861429 isoform X1 n=1 Tax=Tasmannia lanceolata TaxID=3420 RepID=UPI0040638BFD